MSRKPWAIRWGVDYGLDRHGYQLFASQAKPLIIKRGNFNDLVYNSLSGARFAYSTGASVNAKVCARQILGVCTRYRLKRIEVLPWEVAGIEVSKNRPLFSLINKYRVPSKKENFDPLVSRALSTFDPSDTTFTIRPDEHALTDTNELYGILRELFRRHIFPSGFPLVKVYYPHPEVISIPEGLRKIFVELYRTPSVFKVVIDIAKNIYRFWLGKPKGMCVSPLLWEAYRNYWAITERPGWLGHAVLRVLLPSPGEVRLFEELAFGFPNDSIRLSNSSDVMQLAELIYYLDGSINYKSQEGLSLVKAIVQANEDALVGLYKEQYKEDDIRKALHLAIVKLLVLNPRIKPITPNNDPRKLYGYKDIYALTLGAKAGFRYRIKQVIKGWKRNAIIEQGFSLLAKVLTYKIVADLSKGKIVTREGVKHTKPLKLTIPAGTTPEGKAVYFTEKSLLASLKGQIGATGIEALQTALAKPMSTDEFIGYMERIGVSGRECGFYPVKPVVPGAPPPGPEAQGKGIPWVLVFGLAALAIALSE